MEWIQVTIYTSAAGIEPVTGRLYQLGVTGVEIEDEQEFYTFLEENRQSWDYVDDELVRRMAGETRVKIYVSDNPAGHETLAAVRQSMAELKEMDADGEFGRLAISLSNMSEEDWANSWKQYFKPLRIGSKLLICPEWEPVPADAGDRTVFTVNPGMTFGTGSHETTRLCLEAIERHLQKGGAVLDLGCGSGILSIVSLLLGAQSAVAVDIDPNAADAAYANAALNGVRRDHYTVLSGNVITDRALAEKIGARRYDLVLANIVADVILALAPRVPGLLAPGGKFVCSGIIVERRDEVAQALAAQGLAVYETYEEKGWAAMVCGAKRQ